MKKRYLLIAISMTLVQGCYTAPPYPPSSYGSGYSGVSIGIHYSTYPDLVRIPGYPVYYAPRVDSNYFFYDGLYWVFHGDNWYVSSWYNGPWNYVSYYDVPVYVLRVPVRYYRQPPPYFRGQNAGSGLAFCLPKKRGLNCPGMRGWVLYNHVQPGEESLVHLPSSAGQAMQLRIVTIRPLSETLQIQSASTL